ncbi:MAG: SDR family NAD(P)-dependent oxidoreductase [Anaerolineaceae bacterium]|nr:SDR family NAD(P)-dependent oxidoreductase [Anaerolineaceae bacterium]
MTTINGKYILLTGGSRGIGPIIAEVLVARGAHIALAARSEEGLKAAATNLSKFGTQTLIVPVDLSQTSQQQALIETVLNKFGRIDILINNAGLETEGAYLDLSWEEIQKTVEVNLLAPMALTYHVLPQMLEQKEGHIVNIASVAAKIGAPYAATYCGTKAGLSEWTRGLRLELEGSGVHFSTILPGYITEVGMFARFNLKSPVSLGSTTPKQVARAVVKAIEKDKLEMFVNSSPARLLSVACELSPSLGDWLKKVMGVVDFQRKKVENGSKLSL